MAGARVQRRLSAIFAADVAGYSRLMGRDEEGTHSALSSHLDELIEPCITEHGGRVVKRTGDGLLADFPSVVDATRCAIAVQSGMAMRNDGVVPDSQIRFRIGVNVGDIIIDSNDIFGDGVNVAARLQELAEPGGVCVSGDAYRHLRNSLDPGVVYLGEQQLKNIAQAVSVYRLRLDDNAARTPPPLPAKPSVAVLPFQNLSPDSEQEYLADGIVEEIITALAHFRQLFVIARNSTFAYKGRAVDVKQVGRELGVRYVVEGSVRRTSDRLRIAAQLIDTATGAHLWADRIDGTLENLFDLQDEVASSIVGAITPKVEEAEIERSKRKPTESLDAYDYFLQGLAAFDRTTTSRSIIDEALELFMKAIRLDPEFAVAHARAARCYATRKSNGWMLDPTKEVAEAVRLAKKAVELGWDDAVALTYGAYVLGYVGGDLETSEACIDRALLLNPNLAAAFGVSSWVRACLGEPEKSIEHAALAMRLSPFDPRLFAWQFNVGLAHFCAGRYDDAIVWERKSLQQQPNYQSAMRVMAADLSPNLPPCFGRVLVL